MRIDERRNLIGSVLMDWPADRRARVHLCFMGRAVCALLVDPKFGFVTGFAYCHPLERFNARTGSLLALARLRVSYAYREFSSKVRVWMPEMGQEYFVPAFDAVNDKAKVDADFIPAVKRTWSASFTDYMYLSSGMVFRSYAEAKRAGRKLLFEGRSIKNVKNAYCSFCDAGKVVNGLDGKPDLFDSSVCPSDNMDSVFKTLFDDSSREADDSELAGSDSDVPDKYVPVYPDDQIENIDIIAPFLKSGQRCFMDPVTGELYCTD